MRQAIGALPLIILWALPLAGGLAASLIAALDADAWRQVFEHPQLWPGLTLSVWTGSLSTFLATLAALFIAAGIYRTSLWHRLQTISTAGLALPHLAFAIGFGFLIMPSGLIARLAVGGDTPPQWVTTQDPLALSLISALTLKEIPFLLAMIWSVLSRGDSASSLDGQWRAARSLGHAPGSIWLRIVQPQLLRRLIWPIAIVWIYGATVVDMALVIGPTQPPVLSVVVWRDLNHADAAVNARGLAGAMFLTMVLAALMGLALLLWRGVRGFLRRVYVTGPSSLPAPWRLARLTGVAICLAYGLTAALLVVMSFAARWPYPSLWPQSFRLSAWFQVFSSSGSLMLSLGLALMTMILAIVLAVLWFETQPQSRDRWFLGLALLVLGLPQIVLAAGQYRLFLSLDLSGSVTGLFLVHLTPVLAYAVVVLVGPYRAFDQRYAAIARSLHATPVRLWWTVKAPLLRGPLLMAAAVGFSVSMVQFVPAQLIAAGRYATLPMEAVTLSSGGNRALMAVFALALAVPPLFVFIVAGLGGRPRWR